MRTTKKLVVLCLATLMACLSMMPATFSWYARNSTTTNDGFMQYSHSNLPVSGSSTVNVNTIAVNKDGAPTNGSTAVTDVDFGSASTNIQYYKTTIDNSNGSGDIYGDLELGNLINNANIKAGITSPVINEKGFDIAKTPTANNTVRVYFIPTTDYNDFWYNKEYNQSGGAHYHESAYWDMNIRYFIGSESTDVQMVQMANNNKFKDKNDNYPTYIFSFDLPSNVNSFFFFNHWFDKEHDAENNDWNRTPEITEISPGTVYRLTGENIEDSYKLYDTVSSVNVAALMKYYSKVELDAGGYIDIALHKTNVNNEENFSPDYYGTGVSYSKLSGNAKINVNSTDGLITVDDDVSYTNGVATATIRTTVTGTCGDTITADTVVTVREKIEQMPIAQNVLVEKGKKVELYWYVINKTNTTGKIAESIFWTY